ncbi:MAG: hypothetical protein LBJ69_00675 [Holosporales bacterium]|nr:hypothetical protein [Holosporales bacterium]
MQIVLRCLRYLVISRKCISWGRGNRDIETFRRFYDKLKHLNCTFYTDNWDAFSAVIPPERHVIGKQHTVSTEQNNSNTSQNT